MMAAKIFIGSPKGEDGLDEKVDGDGGSPASILATRNGVDFGAFARLT
jgi:hypothetical protein